MVAPALAGRSAPLVFLDLAVPSDVEPGVAALAGCSVHTLDDLALEIGRTVALRREEALAAEAICADAAEEFRAWQAERTVAPAIGRLRARAEALRAAEVERLAGWTRRGRARALRAALATARRQAPARADHAPARERQRPRRRAVRRDRARPVRPRRRPGLNAVLRLGTRGSRLALCQAGLAADALRAAGLGPVAIVPISTVGDRDRRHSFSELGGRGVFSSELEESLRAGQIDVAVHSAKDLTTDDVRRPRARGRAAPRRPARRVVRARALAARGAPRAPASARRRPAERPSSGPLRPDLVVEGLRGNIDTRLRKRGERGLAAIVLAACGLDRLGLGHEIGFRIPTESMLPEVGQGFLALQTRAAEAALLAPVERRRRAARPARRARRRGHLRRRLPRAGRGACRAARDGVAAPARLDRPARRQRLGERERRGRRSGRARSRRRAAGARVRWAAAAGSRARMTVYLVGAGPGDPGLITVRGLELRAPRRGAGVRPADRRRAARRGRGRLPADRRLQGGPTSTTMTQEEIDACLVEHGLAGRFVVRLKGGDPFVFGRGGEEAQALAGGRRAVRGRAGHHLGDRRAGLRRHPGDASRARRPVRRRDRARASRARRQSEIDWDVLARFARHARPPDGRRAPRGHRRLR